MKDINICCAIDSGIYPLIPGLSLQVALPCSSTIRILHSPPRWISIDGFHLGVN